MTTVTQARQLLRARLENATITDASNAAVPLRFQNEDKDSLGNDQLPAEPAPFAYVEFLPEKGSLVSFGSGAGGNRYRTPFELAAYVFVPRNDYTNGRDGLAQAESIAEQIAALFRSFRSGDVSCFDATVQPGGDGASLKPPGMNSDVGNYFWAGVFVSGFFDQIG